MMCCACACDAARVAVVVAARRALVCDFVGRGVFVDLCEYLHVWCVSRLLQSVMCGAVCGLLLVAGEKSCLALGRPYIETIHSAYSETSTPRAPVLDLQVDPACSAAVFRGLWSQPSCMRKALDA